MKYLIFNKEKKLRVVTCEPDAISLQLSGDEEYKEVAEGELIELNITIAPTPVISINKLKTNARQEIDKAASRARKRYVTDIAAQAVIYKLKVEEALTYQADSTKIGAYLQAEAMRTSSSVAAVAQLFIDKNADWEAIGVATENIRLTAKSNIDLLADTATSTDFDVIVDAAIDQLSNV